MAIIGLVDLTHQLIECAALIHYIATHYAVVRSWLFGLLPFRVPVPWHNYIVLGTLLLSVVNIGYFRRTNKVYLLQLVRGMWALIHHPFSFDRAPIYKEPYPVVVTRFYIIDQIAIGFSRDVFIVGTFAYLCGFFALRLESLTTYKLWLEAVTLYSFAGSLFIGAGALLAWRWIGITAIIFGILVGVNELYVHWLVLLKGNSN